MERDNVPGATKMMRIRFRPSTGRALPFTVASTKAKTKEQTKTKKRPTSRTTFHCFASRTCELTGASTDTSAQHPPPQTMPGIPSVPSMARAAAPPGGRAVSPRSRTVRCQGFSASARPAVASRGARMPEHGRASGIPARASTLAGREGARMGRRV